MPPSASSTHVDCRARVTAGGGNGGGSCIDASASSLTPSTSCSPWCCCCCSRAVRLIMPPSASSTHVDCRTRVTAGGGNGDGSCMDASAPSHALTTSFTHRLYKGVTLGSTNQLLMEPSEAKTKVCSFTKPPFQYSLMVSAEKGPCCPPAPSTIKYSGKLTSRVISSSLVGSLTSFSPCEPYKTCVAWMLLSSTITCASSSADSSGMDSS